MGSCCRVAVTRHSLLCPFFFFPLPLPYTERGSSHPADRVQTDPPTVNEGIERLEASYVTRTPAETFVRSHGGEKCLEERRIKIAL